MCIRDRTYVEQQADIRLPQSLQEGLAVEAIDADCHHSEHRKSPICPATRASCTGTRSRGGEVASRDGGPFEFDHLAGDRQPCHPEHRGGRCYPGGAQPRRQHAVVREQRIDVGGVDVEPDEVRGDMPASREWPPGCRGSAPTAPPCHRHAGDCRRRSSRSARSSTGSGCARRRSHPGCTPSPPTTSTG